MLVRFGIVAALASLGFASGASAQGVMPSRLLTADAANAMVIGALAQCQN